MRVRDARVYAWPSSNFLIFSFQHTRRVALPASHDPFAHSLRDSCLVPILTLVGVSPAKQCQTESRRDEFRDMIQDTEALEMGMHRITVGDVLAKKEEGQRGVRPRGEGGGHRHAHSLIIRSSHCYLFVVRFRFNPRKIIGNFPPPATHSHQQLHLSNSVFSSPRLNCHTVLED